MAESVNIQSIKIVATADTSKAESALKRLADTLSKLKGATRGGFKFPDTSKIEKFGEAFSKLNTVDWNAIASGIRATADAMEQIANVRINPDTLRQFTNLAKSYDKVRKAMAKAGDFRPPAAMAGDPRMYEWASKAYFRPPTSSFRQPPSYTRNELAFSRAFASQDAYSQIGASSGSTPLLGNGSVIEGEWSWVESATREVSAFRQVTGDIPEEEEKIEKSTVRLVDVLRDLGFSATKVSNALTNLANSGLKALTSGLKESTRWLGKMLGSMAIAPFRKLGTGIRDITKRLSGFFAALKRIAVYRAIRWALKELTKAFKEGIDNLYQYSILINGKFKQSMDMLATSALYAKNSLAAMVAPIINQLAPAVDLLVDKFVDLLNTVNEALAAMTGAETWTKALKYPKEYAEAADDANGSAKKLRATLLGFDEINRLDDNRKSSRGKQSDLLDYSKMFEEKPVTTKISKYIDAIKKAFKTGNFTEIGHDIGQQLKDGLDRIPWRDIESRISKNASSVATLINGFINVDGLGTTLGRSIGKAFNVAVTKVNTFFGTVEWNKLGTFLGSGFSEAVRTFDTKKLGETLAKAINGGVSLIHGFVSSVHWDELGTFFSNGINGFFNELNTQKLGETISRGLSGALTAVTKLLQQTDFDKVGKKIGELFNAINWTNVLSKLGQAIFAAIKAAIQGIGGLIKESPLVGLAVATAIANGIATALGLPTVTSIISNALLKAVTAGAAASAAGGAAGGVTGGVAGAIGHALGGTTLGGQGAGHDLGGITLGGGAGAAAGLGTLGSIGAVLATIVAGLGVGAYIGREGSTVGNALDDFLGTSKQGVDLKTAEHDDYWLNHTGDEEYWANRAAKAAKNAAEREAAQAAIDNTNLYSLSDDKLRELLTDSEWKYYWEEVFKLGIDNSLTYAELKSMKKTADSQKTYLQDMKDYWERRGITIDINLKSVGSNGSSATSTMMKNAAIQKVHTKMANGGEPQTGTVFLAGERGAEIISSKGGHTQVANRDQISQSVAYGMEQANAESNQLLREQNKLLRAILEKDTNFVVPITTGQVTNALDRQNRREGRAVVTVGG